MSLLSLKSSVAAHLPRTKSKQLQVAGWVLHHETTASPSPPKPLLSKPCVSATAAPLSTPPTFYAASCFWAFTHAECSLQYSHYSDWATPWHCPQPRYLPSHLFIPQFSTEGSLPPGASPDPRWGQILCGVPSEHLALPIRGYVTLGCNFLFISLLH